MDAVAENGDLADLMERIARLGDDADEVSIADVKKEIGERSFGPALAIPAIVEISPIGGIPGLPTLIALLVAIIAAQILFDRDHLWLPGFLENRRVKGARLAKGMRALRKPANWIDALLEPRMRWVTKDPTLRVIAALVILLCCTVPPLELIPFASSIPMGAVALIGLGLMARDGLAMLVAAVLSSATFWGLFEVANGAA
ncbi:exopolysaccharide biosynthesis protein [Cereibacter sp. SYSU M97828]|nr:exopolysaccharide biosynthesis protein [Cereibacter flavus]